MTQVDKLPMFVELLTVFEEVVISTPNVQLKNIEMTSQFFHKYLDLGGLQIMTRRWTYLPSSSLVTTSHLPYHLVSLLLEFYGVVPTFARILSHRIFALVYEKASYKSVFFSSLICLAKQLQKPLPLALLQQNHRMRSTIAFCSLQARNLSTDNTIIRKGT
ncbi:hypothetical protein L9F63_026372, partial [Diploptera punctata]